MISPANTMMSTAISGLNSAQARLEVSAKKNAQNVSANDLVSEFVDQLEARNAFVANIRVLKTADEITGRVLDLKA